MAERQNNLKTLKGKRTGKKGTITKRIKKLEELMESDGSRRVMKMLLDGLEATFSELQQVCDDITAISDEHDELNCLEDIRINIEICSGAVVDHLEGRVHEPPSTETSSWVAKHAHLSCVAF